MRRIFTGFAVAALMAVVPSWPWPAIRRWPTRSRRSCATAAN